MKETALLSMAVYLTIVVGLLTFLTISKKADAAIEKLREENNKMWDDFLKEINKEK